MVAVPVHAPRGLDFDHVASHVHRADHGILVPRLEHRDEAGIASSHADQVERLPGPCPRSPWPLSTQQLPIEQQVHREPPAFHRVFEDDRAGFPGRGNEPLDTRHEFALQVSVLPPPLTRRNDVSLSARRPPKVPRQL